MSLMEIRPIDREPLIDAIKTASIKLLDDGLIVESGKASDMVGICSGGLLFILTGENSELWTDADIKQAASNEDALAAILFCDLRDGWQGFPSENDKQAAWTICNAIASAFVKVVGC